MTERIFSLGQILSVSGHRLLCDMGGVYEILNYVTGDNLYTHQLPRACESARPWLIKQYPWLASIDESGVTTDNWRDFLAEQIAAHGAELPIKPLPPEGWEAKDAIAELAEMVGSEKVIVVAVPEVQQ